MMLYSIECDAAKIPTMKPIAERAAAETGSDAGDDA